MAAARSLIALDKVRGCGCARAAGCACQTGEDGASPAPLATPSPERGRRGSTSPSERCGCTGATIRTPAPVSGGLSSQVSPAAYRGKGAVAQAIEDALASGSSGIDATAQIGAGRASPDCGFSSIKRAGELAPGGGGWDIGAAFSGDVPLEPALLPEGTFGAQPRIGVGAFNGVVPFFPGPQSGHGGTAGKAYSVYNSSESDPTACAEATGYQVVEGCNLGGSWNIEGSSVGGMAILDWVVMYYMLVNCIPNGALTVVSPDGRLVYCKAFTFCSLLQQHGEPVILADVHSLFRVASLSKVITTLATMAAVEDGVFGTDGVNALASDYWSFVAGFAYWGGSVVVPELLNIELHHLLTHSAGWVEAAAYGAYTSTGPAIPAASYSPNYMPEKNDEALSYVFTCTPVTKDMISFSLNYVPLTWDPGGPDSYWSYSNHGFTLLAGILEAATGTSYESYVQSRVFGRIGAVDSCLGDTEKSKRKATEVYYYGAAFPDEGGDPTDNIMALVCDHVWPQKDKPYGYFNLRNSDGGSGWLCSIYDLALMLQDVFVGPSAMLSASTISDMLTTSIPRSASAKQYYGWMGSLLNPNDYWKSGHLEGTQALAFNYASSVQGDRAGASFAYVFNRYSAAWNSTVEPSFQQSLNNALKAITDWGSSDLFGTL